LTLDQATNAIASEPFLSTLPPDASVVLDAAGGSLGAGFPRPAPTVRAEIDDVNAVAESNERNNTP
jgi:hypothetical protein